MNNRFNGIKFDEQSITEKERFRMVYESLEGMLDQLEKSRSQGKAYTKLEEAYFWTNKAIKESQIKRVAKEQNEEREKRKNESPNVRQIDCAKGSTGGHNADAPRRPRKPTTTRPSVEHHNR